MGDTFAGIFDDIPIVGDVIDLVKGVRDLIPGGGSSKESSSGGGGSTPFSMSSFKNAMATQNATNKASQVSASLGQVQTPNSSKQLGTDKTEGSVNMAYIYDQWLSRMQDFAMMNKNISVTQGGKP